MECFFVLTRKRISCSLKFLHKTNLSSNLVSGKKMAYDSSVTKVFFEESLVGITFPKV